MSEHAAATEPVRHPPDAGTASGSMDADVSRVPPAGAVQPATRAEPAIGAEPATEPATVAEPATEPATGPVTESTTGPATAAGPVTAEDADGPHPHRQLDGRTRWLLAGAEVVAGACLLVIAVWAWQRASIPVRLPDSDNPVIPDFTSRLSGPWAAAAFVAATVTGLLVLDAVRHAVLAARGQPSSDTQARAAEHPDAGVGA